MSITSWRADSLSGGACGGELEPIEPGGCAALAVIRHGDFIGYAANGDGHPLGRVEGLMSSDDPFAGRVRRHADGRGHYTLLYYKGDGRDDRESGEDVRQPQRPLR